MDKIKSGKKKIALIYTGGTIGVSEELSGNILKSEGTGDFLYKKFSDAHPEINDKYFIYMKRHTCLLSENIVPDDWSRIANSIKAEINSGVDGIVVAHGTDSLPYTSAAISFMLSEVPIPVAFTGSLNPPDRDGTDAIKNLLASILFAAETSLAGVYVVFKSNNELRNIYLGTRLLSIRPYRDYYESVDGHLVGSINLAERIIKIFDSNCQKRYKPDKEIKTYPKINPNVAFFELHPGFDPRYIEMAFNNGAKGIILNLFHSGTACTRNGLYSMYSLLPVIRSLSNKIPIFGLPLDTYKITNVYNTTDKLIESGLIPLKKISPESAIVKLMWILGRYEKINEIKSEMERNISNEIVQEPK